MPLEIEIFDEQEGLLFPIVGKTFKFYFFTVYIKGSLQRGNLTQLSLLKSQSSIGRLAEIPTFSESLRVNSARFLWSQSEIARSRRWAKKTEISWGLKIHEARVCRLIAAFFFDTC